MINKQNCSFLETASLAATPFLRHAYSSWLYLIWRVQNLTLPIQLLSLVGKQQTSTLFYCQWSWPTEKQLSWSQARNPRGAASIWNLPELPVSEAVQYVGQFDLSHHKLGPHFSVRSLLFSESHLYSPQDTYCP